MRRALLLLLLPLLLAPAARAGAQPARRVQLDTAWLRADQPVRRIDPARLRVLRAAAESARAPVTVVGSSGTDTVPATGPVTLRPGQLVVVRTGDSVRRVRPRPPLPPSNPDPTAQRDTAERSSDTEFELPYEMGTPEVPNLRPRMMLRGGGLRYVRAEDAYVARLLVRLLDGDRPGRQVALRDTIFFQFAGDADAVDPDPLAVTRAGGRSHEVTVRAGRTAGDTLRLLLIPSFDSLAVEFPIPVLRARLVVTPSPARIAGFGLEKTRLVVQPPDGGSQPVALTAVRGRVTPATLTVSPDAVGVAELRSRGVGEDTVRVAGGAYEGVATVRYQAPWLFLVAVVLGGAVGGLLNAASRERARRRRRRRGTGRLPVEGILTGFAAAVLYAAGINVFGWAPDADFGEAVMFAVAFAGGLAGPRIFDRFLPAEEESEDGGDGGGARPPAPAPAGETPAPVG
jgi:hypothetical protein